MGKRVLFVSHDATRSGAPIVLLHLLRWFREKSDLDFDLLVQRPGELSDTFQQIGRLWHLAPPILPKPGLLQRVSRKLSQGRSLSHLADLEAALDRGEYDLVYANTAATSPALSYLARWDLPTICHVHELEFALQSIGMESWGEVKARADRFVAASQAVRDNLVRNHGLADDQVEVHYECISRASLPTADPALGRRMRHELGIAEDAVVIGACGALEWRKGPDLFLQLARALRARDTGIPLHFLWIGGELEGGILRKLQFDLERLQLTSLVRFVGPRPNPLDYFAGMDLFAMLSREDPFPVVCVEAAAMGLPIVCFAGAGGIPELVGTDAGAVVPYLDLDALTGTCADLAKNAHRRQQLGARAAEKVIEWCDVDRVAPRILDLIQQSRRSSGSVRSKN